MKITGHEAAEVLAERVLEMALSTAISRDDADDLAQSFLLALLTMPNDTIERFAARARAYINVKSSLLTRDNGDSDA